MRRGNTARGKAAIEASRLLPAIKKLKSVVEGKNRGGVRHIIEAWAGAGMWA